MLFQVDDSCCLPPLVILYGSATGNSEHIAKALSLKLSSINSSINSSSNSFSNISCCTLTDAVKKWMPIWKDNDKAKTLNGKYGVIIITSTTGDGDPPENASR